MTAWPALATGRTSGVDSGPATRELNTRPRNSSRFVLAGLSTGAAAIHLEVVPEHIKEYWPFAAFLAVVALFQTGWAFAVAGRPTGRTYLIGAIVSTALVALWLASRTCGLPIGPQPWHPEPAGLLDVLASTLEAAVVLMVVKACLGGSPGPRRRVSA